MLRAPIPLVVKTEEEPNELTRDVRQAPESPVFEKEERPSESMSEVPQASIPPVLEKEERPSESMSEVPQASIPPVLEKEERPSESMSEVLQASISPVVEKEEGLNESTSEVLHTPIFPIIKKAGPNESVREVVQAAVTPEVEKAEPNESVREVVQAAVTPEVEKAEPNESVREVVQAPVTPEVVEKKEGFDDFTQVPTKKGKGKKIKGSKATKTVESDRGAQSSSNPVLVHVSKAMTGQDEVGLALANENVPPIGGTLSDTQRAPIVAEPTREEEPDKSVQIPIKNGKGKKDKKKRRQTSWKAESDTPTTPDISGSSAQNLAEPAENGEVSEQTGEPKTNESDKEGAGPITGISGKKKAKKDKKKRLKQLVSEKEPSVTTVTPDVPVRFTQESTESVEEREEPEQLQESEKHESDKQKAVADEAVEVSAKKVEKGKEKREQTAWEEDFNTNTTPDVTIGFPKDLAESVKAKEGSKKVESDKMKGANEDVEVSAKKAKGGKKKRQQMTPGEEPNTNVMLDASASSTQDPAASEADATLPGLAGLGLMTTNAAALTVPKKSDHSEEPDSYFPEAGSMHSPAQEDTVLKQTEHLHDQPQAFSVELDTEHGVKATKTDLSQGPDSYFPRPGLVRSPENESTIAEQVEQSNDQPQLLAGVEMDQGVKATSTTLDESNCAAERDSHFPEAGSLEREGTISEQPDQSHAQPRNLVEEAETDKGLDTTLTGHRQELDSYLPEGGSLKRDDNFSEQPEQSKLSHEQPQIVVRNAETDTGLATALIDHKQEPDSDFREGGSLKRESNSLEQPEQYHQQPKIVVEDTETDEGLKTTLSHLNGSGDHVLEGQEMEHLPVPENEVKQPPGPQVANGNAEPIEGMKVNLTVLGESEARVPMSQDMEQSPGPEDPIEQSYHHSQAITGNEEPVEGVKPSSANLNESALHAAVDQEMEQLPGPKLGKEHDAEAGSERNRDSGIQFSEQAIAPEDPSRAIFRDSGYIPSPITRPGWDETSNHSESERPPRPLTPTSSSEDLGKRSGRPSKRTSNPDFTPGLARGTGSDQDVGRSEAELSAAEIEPHREPSPVDSTTKDRSSALFNSPPSNLFEQYESEPPSDTRHPWSPSGTHQSPPPRPIIETTSDARDQPASFANHLDNQSTGMHHPRDLRPEEPYQSVFGPPASSHDVVERALSPPRTPLQTIPEDDREHEKSPSLRRRRSPSIVASPTRSHTSTGRPVTPNAAGRSTPELQPAHKKLRRSPGSQDMRRASSGSEHADRPHRLKSPAPDVERSATPGSWHSDSGTAAAAAGAAGLGAAGLGAAALGAAVLLSGSRDRKSMDGTKSLGNVDVQPTASEQRRARQQLEAEALPLSSTYDPVKDQGKETVRDMADVYVSHRLFLLLSLLTAMDFFSDYVRRTAMAKFQDLPGLPPDHRVFKNVEAYSRSEISRPGSISLHPKIDRLQLPRLMQKRSWKKSTTTRAG